VKFTRDTWLAVGLFGLLALLTVLAAARQTDQQKLRPLDSASTQPDGARALALWLNELGAKTRLDVAVDFAIPANTQITLILEPSQPILAEDWKIIDQWVTEGGTLVLAGDDFIFGVAANHYNFALNYLDTVSQPLTAQTPLFNSPPLATATHLQTNAYLETDRTDFVTHLAVAEGPVLVSFDQGQGRVWLMATAAPFTNAGLKETGNPALVLNLVSTPNRRATIWFNEWHHGKRLFQSELAGPTDWLLSVPAGQSILLVAVIIFITLLWRGRRFGRPVPLPKDIARRAPLEYIAAIANLNRRAGHRAQVLQRYHQQLKRTLGHRYRLPAHLPDDHYARQLAAYNPAVDEQSLRALLANLSRPTVSETELIHLAAQVADWIGKT
jgi:hypothetical protein